MSIFFDRTGWGEMSRDGTKSISGGAGVSLGKAANPLRVAEVKAM